MLEEIYFNDDFGVMNIIATIVAWLLGILFIWGGKSTKNAEDVQYGLAIIVFGSIPFLNGMALSVILVLLFAALMGAGVTFAGKWLAEKIIGED